MKDFVESFAFPQQRVSKVEREKPEWYANVIDWIIAAGQVYRDSQDIETKYRVLHGDIPNEFYKKTLNPYNAQSDRHKRFPATMRNYDMMKGIIRRFVSEYIKNPHDFIVGANNPEVILSKNIKLREELTKIVQEQIASRIQQSYTEWVNNGNEPQQFNPQEHIDIETFIKEFNENYIDDISSQGAEILNVIRDITEDTLFYARAYFDFVTFGEVYTYADVIGTNLIKRNVSVRDAFPIPTNYQFVEDSDMFAERRKMSYQEIIDEYDEYLDDNDRKFLDTYYAKYGVNNPTLNYNEYKRYYSDICKKFTTEEVELFEKNPTMARDLNSELFDVWHVVWRGEIRRCIVTYVTEAGIISERIEEDGYELNPDFGDISLEYIFEPQVFEGVRIGTRQTAIYPYKTRAIAFNRKGKLPYNGVYELLPGFGKFSIIDIVLPFQVLYNIIAYHRELSIAKNKLSVLMIAKSLLGKVPEDTIYKMIADGVLYVDDTTDQGMLRAQQVRSINSDISAYINQLSQLLIEIEQSAKNQVDMTPQRYGEIAGYAGKATTQEAITRGSMGSVIIEFVMDCIRERDYARDMDFSKLAWIDGINTSYRDDNNNLKYLSADLDKHIYADYVIKAKNSIKEQDKLEQLKQYAFSAAQNGDNMMAIAAIQGDNVAAIAKLIKKFNEEKQQHETQLQEQAQQLEQMKQEFEITKIQAKGEEDRKTLELKGLIDKEIELIQADSNLLTYPNDTAESIKQAGAQRLESMRGQVNREKIELEREKMLADIFNKERDRKVKEKDIDTKLKIARTNKNRYDKK